VYYSFIHSSNSVVTAHMLEHEHGEIEMTCACPNGNVTNCPNTCAAHLIKKLHDPNITHKTTILHDPNMTR
jgi:hypothetical protein